MSDGVLSDLAPRSQFRQIVVREAIRGTNCLSCRRTLVVTLHSVDLAFWIANPLLQLDIDYVQPQMFEDILSDVVPIASRF